MKHLTSILFLIVLLSAQLQAQSSEEGNQPVDRPDNIDLTFTRGFLLTTNESDSIPFNSGSSGSIGIGASFKLHFANNNFGFRLTPGISWTKFAYEQKPEKIFPSQIDSSRILDIEKHRLTFVDMGLGIFVNLSKDEDGDSRFYIEGGGYLGRRTSGVYKIRYEKEGSSPDVALEVKERTKGVESLEDWRYGIYGRVGYKWIALYYSYRLSDVFQANPLNAAGNPSGFQKLSIPPMELGITVFL